MRLIALRERGDGEQRVAITPESAKAFEQSGFEVALESGAGMSARFDDDQYRHHGVAIEEDRLALVKSADIWLCVGAPSPAEAAELRDGAMLVGFLRPLDDPGYASRLAAAGVTSFAVELMPRISRAQSMDALSSQASIAGYRAVVSAAAVQSKIFPMMTTPAGTIPPARVLVIGAGVAGLQAIATAHRLGARVEAYDTRPAVKEQVESLGARFLELDLRVTDAETEGGYAKDQGEEFLGRQRALLVERLGEADVVVTTALVPGRPAPRLIDRAGVEAMQYGSVIVDLAAPNGGNCELTEPDRVVEHRGVRILGPTNIASEAAFGASRMYSRNLLAFVRHLCGEEPEQALDLEDEIVSGALLTHQGRITNAAVAALAEESGQ